MSYRSWWLALPSGAFLNMELISLVEPADGDGLLLRGAGVTIGLIFRGADAETIRGWLRATAMPGQFARNVPGAEALTPPTD